jgi:molecular chaperone GrpE
MTGRQSDNEEDLEPQDQDAVPVGDPAEVEAAAGTTATADDLQRLQAERDELYQRLARATADYQNSRRRLEAELDQRVEFAHSQLIKALIPVIDNFERALAVDPARAEAETILKGLQLVHDQWINVLRQQKVDEIAPQAGEAFDPNCHEALMQQDSEHPPGSVVQLLQKGYSLRGRTLRPAQVIVTRE